MSAFAQFRNSKRLVGKIEVNFESHGARFLNDSLVDKLLIQNKGELPWKAKDSLVLSMLESLLEDNPYIDKAEVFHFHQGVLGVNILEKIAVLRVQAQDQFYLDRFGNQFPLSNNHTPKVPLYLGKFKENQKKFYGVAAMQKAKAMKVKRNSWQDVLRLKAAKMKPIKKKVTKTVKKSMKKV